MAVRSSTRRGAGMLAALLRVAGLAIVAVLVLHVVLTLLRANPEVWLVSWVAQLADLFDLGLSALFQPADPGLAVTLNYGTAALIWFVITAVVVRLVRRAA